ncbi:hypothetical protein JD844_013497 [Phrynosoma platyrhinos]|uniref:B30.2/SPRY domain-containing protein n=1 Tax=Phrynosoma platyrhinos TaxID=52577 RepID=A0ABQ7TM60_PHRPL|nr:hypothetical protein JD844_013497 [Phrynosoma platyrhinos]
MERKLSEEQRKQTFLTQIGLKKEEIRSAFKKVQKFLKVKERLWLDQLGELEKETEKSWEENVTNLSEEIGRLRHRKYLNKSLWRKPFTKDLTNVEWEDRYQDLPDNPARFNREFCVLGCERFTSGRHCWEVEVDEEAGAMWALGVARESVRRKGIFKFNPNEGIWAVGKRPYDSPSPCQLCVFTSPEWISLNLRREPRNIRVSLVYEEGRVEFFDADTENLIFTFFSASFSGEEIKPFFWVVSGEKIKAHLESLKAEREKLQDQKLARQQRMKDHLIQLETERQMMASFFEGLQKFVEEKKHFCLSQLGELKEEIKKGEKENLTKVSEDISQLSQRITALEKKCQQPASEYLQRSYEEFSRTLLPSAEAEMWACNGVKLESLEQALNTASWDHSLLMDSLKQGINQVNVTLDPITAHPRLFLSENLKVLRWDRVPQDLPYSPERFKKQPCVLGCEKFTSGRYCWKVEILDGETREEDLGGEPAWAVGIARDSVERKEYFNLNLDEGIWAVGKACEDLTVPCQISAFTIEPTTVILKKEPKRICVNLDYDAGQVDFLDADTDDLIFTFHSASFFGDQIRPFFYTRGWECNLKC